jgi:hypothetical protein
MPPFSNPSILTNAPIRAIRQDRIVRLSVQLKSVDTVCPAVGTSRYQQSVRLRQESMLPRPPGGRSHRCPGSSHCCVSGLEWLGSPIVIQISLLTTYLCNIHASYSLHTQFAHIIQYSKSARCSVITIFLVFLSLQPRVLRQSHPISF